MVQPPNCQWKQNKLPSVTNVADAPSSLLSPVAGFMASGPSITHPLPGRHAGVTLGRQKRGRACASVAATVSPSYRRDRDCQGGGVLDLADGASGFLPPTFLMVTRLVELLSGQFFWECLPEAQPNLAPPALHSFVKP